MVEVIAGDDDDASHCWLNWHAEYFRLMLEQQ